MNFEYPKFIYNYPFINDQTSYDKPDPFQARDRKYTREHLTHVNGERQAVFNLLTHASHNAWHVQYVDYGDERVLCLGRGDKFVMEQVFAVDECMLIFQKNGKTCWVRIILGNSPEDVVADWGVPRNDIECFNDMMEEFIQENETC